MGETIKRKIMKKVLFDKLKNEIAKVDWFTDKYGNIWVDVDRFGVQMSGNVTIRELERDGRYEIRELHTEDRKWSREEVTELLKKQREETAAWAIFEDVSNTPLIKFK